MKPDSEPRFSHERLIQERRKMDQHKGITSTFPIHFYIWHFLLCELKSIIKPHSCGAKNNQYQIQACSITKTVLCGTYIISHLLEIAVIKLITFIYSINCDLLQPCKCNITCTAARCKNVMMLDSPTV